MFADSSSKNLPGRPHQGPNGITSPRPSDDRLVVALVVQRRLRGWSGLLRRLQLLLQVMDALLELLAVPRKIERLLKVI